MSRPRVGAWMFAGRDDSAKIPETQ